MAIVFASLWGVTVLLALVLFFRKPKAQGYSQDEVDRRLADAKSAGQDQVAAVERQYQSRLDEKSADVKTLQDKLSASEEANAMLRESAAKAEAELESGRRQLEAERENYAKIQAENETRFRDIAQKVIDASQEKMKKGGEECLGGIVAPLLKDIKDFREKVESANAADAQRAGQLTEKIEGLVKQTNDVSSRANELAQAIRGEAQVTGAWAEIQLKRILELSGLKETIDYTYQETFAGADSTSRNLRTDVLVKISEKEWIVIDSKNTMEAYVGYVNATGEARETLCTRIVESVKNHVDELKSAEYQKNIGKAFRYAFMYIPFEEVYLIAMKAEVKVGGERLPLRDYARRNDVIFVNSTSLLPTLQLVAVTWQNQRSDRNAAKIKAACEGLCQKMETFLASYQDLGKALGKTAQVYSNGLGQLANGKGNVLGRFRKLAELDVPVAAEIPEADVYAADGAKQIEMTVPLLRAEGLADA